MDGEDHDDDGDSPDDNQDGDRDDANKQIVTIRVVMEVMLAIRIVMEMIKTTNSFKVGYLQGNKCPIILIFLLQSLFKSFKNGKEYGWKR